MEAANNAKTATPETQQLVMKAALTALGSPDAAAALATIQTVFGMSSTTDEVLEGMRPGQGFQQLSFRKKIPCAVPHPHNA